MGLHVQVGGDATQGHDPAEEALSEAFDSQHFLGLVEVSLHYRAGEGYQILQAQLFPAGLAASGRAAPVPEPPSDYRQRVREVLEQAGVRVIP